MTPAADLRTWLAELNRVLARMGQTNADLGEALYGRDAGLSPAGAALLIAEERLSHV
jgi:hypothetical protein